MIGKKGLIERSNIQLVKNFGRVTSSFDELKSGTVREVLPTSYDLQTIEDFDHIA